MTYEEIIEMAKQAGFNSPNPHDGYMGLAYDCRKEGETGSSLEAFAKLVAAKEREICAQICDKEVEDWKYDADVVDVAMAIRERGNK